MEKFKTIMKYVSNTLAIINALLLGLEPIWYIPYTDKITKTIIVIIGVISTYLLSGKFFKTLEENKNGN